MSCTAQKDQTPEAGKSKLKNGIVKDMRGLDGCAFLILMEDGKTLQPLNLDSSFMQNELNVQLRFTVVEGMSVCMKGDMVQINEISKSK